MTLTVRQGGEREIMIVGVKNALLAETGLQPDVLMEQ